jgi:CDP-glucose 4,6-dehydratase
MGAAEGHENESRMIDRAFWRDRRVLLTGHTGFKGAWLSLWLERLGAQVWGLSLPPDTEPALFSMLAPLERHRSRFGDIRDPAAVAAAVQEARPQIAIHMAAQSLVRRSYRQPVATLATNVMGTAHLLDALRGAGELQAVLVVTTDKVYRNDGHRRAFAESDPLGGHDPYSASKAAAELVCASFGALLAPRGVAVATARAGNVIGGGDFAEDRLVPDAWRAKKSGAPLRLRNPGATRPWQHVLDPLAGYLVYLQRLAAGKDVPAALNFGPVTEGQGLTVADVANTMLGAMFAQNGWVFDGEQAPPEAEHLALDPALAIGSLGWRPRLPAAQALQWTAEWYRALDEGAAPRMLSLEQLARYEALA